MRQRASILLAVAVAIATAVLANVALLHTATSGNDPVGKLNPRVELPATPANVVRPHTGPVESGDDRDD
ncbi:MAG TPA: hypothetical protein VFB35_04055 [Gaiellaceae bacterium]|nr:hypothetical protein [Gaiellaceae bacterium]